jgi:glycerate kinase
VKIICAPDSFKETLSAPAAAKAMAEGATRAGAAIQCDLCPIADGGEGSLDVILLATGGQRHTVDVHGPLGDRTAASFGIVDQSTAIVELAQASGLGLLTPSQRQPLLTSTFGTGELILAAHRAGCQDIVLCIGGSATVDGGTGIAQALGYRFIGHGGRLIDQPICGGRLLEITRIDPPEHNLPLRIGVACDVTSPLCGVDGAAAVYGPQKGATPSQVQMLDEGLRHFAQIVGGDPQLPGMGAAGGVAFGMTALCGAQLHRGIEMIMELVNFNSRLGHADLVLTGEGTLDEQSLHGKACMGVAHRAHNFGLPTIAIVGCAGKGAEQCLSTGGRQGLREYIALADRFGMQRAMREPQELIATVAEQIARRYADMLGGDEG